MLLWDIVRIQCGQATICCSNGSNSPLIPHCLAASLLTIREITVGVDISQCYFGLPHRCTTKSLTLEHALSSLPALINAQIVKLVETMICKGVFPCLDFFAQESRLVSNDNTACVVNSAAGY